MNKNLLRQLQSFRRLSGGFRASRVILTANNFSIFEHLKTPRTSDALAKAIKTDPRATRILLDAVTALGLLRKTGEKYRNTPAAETFLVKDSTWYQGDMLRHSEALWKSWSGLDEVVRTGKPNRSGGRDYDSFIRAMQNNAVLLAPDVISAIDLKGVTRALDLGGGPGAYSVELARRKISVTMFDLPETVEIAKKLVTGQKIKNVFFVRGDFHTDDIGSGFDLVFISQILHSLSEDECLTLLKKAYSALNPKGRIAIHEFSLDDTRTAPVPGALFAVNMLVNTPAGRSYTPREMKGWLTKAGFKGLNVKSLGDTVVVTGRKNS